MVHFSRIKEEVQDSIKSLGIVFGDIGTSPIYTFSAIFAIIPSNLENLMGVTSLIIWTLILLVTVQYAWLAMSLAEEYHGEGGIIVLRQILMPLLTNRGSVVIITLLAFLGTSLFIGDGVVTPAISILSAVEGLKYIPNIGFLTQNAIVAVSIVITVALFAFQKRGTERLSLAFGPIMLIWFLLLAVSGLQAMLHHPVILYSVLPIYAIKFLLAHHYIGILVLSKVILCATGSEALYTDMGHLGRRPIIQAWTVVFPILCITYLGQAAYVLKYPNSQNIFYEMMLTQFKPLYVPILILSIIATVIASQAMISGLFSIVYQAIAMHLIPRLHVVYTSRRMMSQIFIPAVNGFLLIFVLITIIKFKSAQNLTEAYGIAVSGTMTITAILLTLIFFLKHTYIKAAVAFFLIAVNVLFLGSNLIKISSGGYWPLFIACIPFTLIIIYALGQRQLSKALKMIPRAIFLEKFALITKNVPHIKGTALFLSKRTDAIPAYIGTTIFTNNILYEENIIVKVESLKTAFGTITNIQKTSIEGLSILEIKIGYLEVKNIDKILKSLDIHPKVIFYGLEDFHTKNPLWRVYIIIKKMTLSFVQFYQFPVTKLHGVVVQINL